MDLSYGVTEFDRERGNLPSLPVINMFAEQVPTEDQPILQSRPGLQTAGIVFGSGPVKALYQTDAVLNNTVFGISGGNLYSPGTLIGPIDGSGPAKLAAFETLLFANQGQSIYSWDGTTLSAITTPGGFAVTDICVGASRLIVIEKDTGVFYWSDALTSNIDALSFATAENSPDKLKACLYVGDVLYLFGSKTVELWPVTTDPTAPFQPLIGRVYPVGIKDTGCATEFNNGFAWISNKNQVCLNDPNSVVSQPYLEAKIEDSTTTSLWNFVLEGTEFLAVRLDDGTHVYNSRTRTWSEFQSAGGNWIPQCYINGYFGSSNSGDLLSWSSNHTDLGSYLERRFRAGSEITSPSLPLNNVFVKTNPGHTTFLTGTYSDPVIELRTSKDGGFSWSPWKPKSLGETGHYRELIQWRSLGYFGYPGCLIEIRVTDPVPFRVSGVTANEPYGVV